MGTHETVDAVVIGAGFGGIYAMHKLVNELGLTTVGFDRAGGPGGTWYWNRYPGALSDSESYVYQYSFDKDLYQDTIWKNTYLTQPEILSYLEGVVDRFDLRRHFRFDMGVSAQWFDEEANQWVLTTDDGATIRATYVINAVGLLAAINMPDIPGRDDFQGRLVHTAAWPEDLDVTGKRVAVIGTGSTGQQVVTALGPQVEALSVFVRTPQYSVPVGLRPMREGEVEDTHQRYEQMWGEIKESALAFGIDEVERSIFDSTEEERERIFSRPGTRAADSGSCSAPSGISPPTKRPTGSPGTSSAARSLRRSRTLRRHGRSCRRASTPGVRCATTDSTRHSTCPTSNR